MHTRPYEEEKSNKQLVTARFTKLLLKYENPKKVEEDEEDLGKYGIQMWGIGYESDEHLEQSNDLDEEVEGEEGQKEMKSHHDLVEKMLKKEELLSEEEMEIVAGNYRL